MLRDRNLMAHRLMAPTQGWLDVQLSGSKKIG